MIYSAIILFYFLLYVDGKIRCLQSYNPHSVLKAIIKECPIEGDSCVTFYTNDNPIPRHGCLSKFEFFSPQFRYIECPEEPQTARCFASSTNKSIHRVFLHRIIHLPMSDVLYRAGIDKLCCCQGYGCNNNNKKIEKFLKHNHRIDEDYFENANPSMFSYQISNAINSKLKRSTTTVSFFSIYLTITAILCILVIE
uniref:TGF-beta family profile domain-containing protein n=1 Tax=Strongyloides venezuelensis TaxID=75913 RepID=A0A0K0FF47_STRVS